MNRALLIFNPASGGADPEEGSTTLQIALDPLVGETVVTTGKGDARDAAFRAGKSAGKFDAILVAGGDGTINEVINGLMDSSEDHRSPLPIGLIPQGTQNVLAAELELPNHDLPELHNIFAAGKTREIDLGRAGDRYFTLMAGFGFDAAVVNDVVRPIKQLIGPGAYMIASLGALAKYASTAVRLTIDGERYETDAYLVIVANAASYGYKQIKLTPFAVMDDGWLDVCVFERAVLDKVGFVTQMMAVIARRHLRDPRVRYYRCRKITVESKPAILGQLDGDPFVSTPVTLHVVPKALRVFVP
jgi:YegS/Rv2252/BmrU family lipid kinase